MVFTARCVSNRDAVNDLALHFFAKMKIMVIKDVEREDIEFVCKVLKRTAHHATYLMTWN